MLLKGYSCFCTQESPLEGLKDHMRCWGWILGQLCARQVPSALHSLFGPSGGLLCGSPLCSLHQQLFLSPWILYSAFPSQYWVLIMAVFSLFFLFFWWCGREIVPGLFSAGLTYFPWNACGFLGLLLSSITLLPYNFHNQTNSLQFLKLWADYLHSLRGS